MARPTFGLDFFGEIPTKHSMAFWFPLGFVALLFAWLAFSQRRGRRKLLARFRAE